MRYPPALPSKVSSRFIGARPTARYRAWSGKQPPRHPRDSSRC
ncbi:MAG: DUF1658 domain-containing protein [Betaproteobacteria bacterium]|nr:DUF1658 domain-containing protein [Betaproteobacteria bacterium]